MDKKYLGTDGIRGRGRTHPITPGFVLKAGLGCGHAFASTAGLAGDFDPVQGTRSISGYMFESAPGAGLSAAGAPRAVARSGCRRRRLPTCTAPFRPTRYFHQARITPCMITALSSFSAACQQMPGQPELDISGWLDCTHGKGGFSSLCKVFRVERCIGRYIEFCKRQLVRPVYRSRV